jgi:hypothetical protein
MYSANASCTLATTENYICSLAERQRLLTHKPLFGVAFLFAEAGRTCPNRLFN